MKGKHANLILKLDLEMAFDKLEWSFIRESLIFFNFPMKLTNLIMSCVSTSSISILVNGGKFDFFNPSRGIRQGDPMSPYLFIIYMERLSRAINVEVQKKAWYPIKITTRGPRLSHLFFADDPTLFAKANTQNYHTILTTMSNFCKSSGQSIKYGKSKIIFSADFKEENASKCSNILNIKTSDSFGKYLGFPIIHSKRTHKDFQFIIDSMNSRLEAGKLTSST
ncbi:hypothetical protein KY284_010910 [Solanum tuberosum]|nr:hypothetical protein KY284_010910 [Solanum tuberosum]